MPTVNIIVFYLNIVIRNYWYIKNLLIYHNTNTQPLINIPWSLETFLFIIILLFPTNFDRNKVIYKLEFCYSARLHYFKDILYGLRASKTFMVYLCIFETTFREAAGGAKNPVCDGGKDWE